MKKLEKLGKFGAFSIETSKIFGGLKAGATTVDLDPVTTQSGSCADVRYTTQNDDKQTISECIDFVCPN